MSKIFDLSWKKNSLLAKLHLLFLAQGKFLGVTATKLTDDWRAGYVQLASTHYSIASTGAAKLHQALRPHILMPFLLLFWFMAWLPLTAFCFWRMLPLVRKAEKLGGWEAMTANQIDICQSILRERGKHREAERCILSAFDGVKEVPPHTEGLLVIGLIDSDLHQQNVFSGIFLVDHLSRVVCAAEEAEAKEPLQSIRIYRDCARLMQEAKKKGINLREEDISLTAEELLAKARELAEKCGAKDQLVKLA